MIVKEEAVQSLHDVTVEYLCVICGHTEWQDIYIGPGSDEDEPEDRPDDDSDFLILVCSNNKKSQT